MRTRKRIYAQTNTCTFTCVKCQNITVRVPMNSSLQLAGRAISGTRLDDFIHVCVRMLSCCEINVPDEFNGFYTEPFANCVIKDMGDLRYSMDR